MKWIKSIADAMNGVSDVAKIIAQKDPNTIERIRTQKGEVVKKFKQINYTGTGVIIAIALMRITESGTTTGNLVLLGIGAIYALATELIKEVAKNSAEKQIIKNESL